MRRISMLSVVLTTVSCAASAFAQSEPPSAPAQPEKKIGVGADLLFLLPIGDYAAFAGPPLGPVLRGGYRVAPSLELTARTGFLLGLSEGTGVVSNVTGKQFESKLSIVPVWAGARYFLMSPDAGLYGVGELGLNIFLPPGREMRMRFGANAGVGYVISKELPIDIRGQFTVLNLFENIPADAGMEKTYFAIGLSAGYTFQL